MKILLLLLLISIKSYSQTNYIFLKNNQKYTLFFYNFKLNTKKINKMYAKTISEKTLINWKDIPLPTNMLINTSENYLVKHSILNKKITIYCNDWIYLKTHMRSFNDSTTFFFITEQDSVKLPINTSKWFFNCNKYNNNWLYNVKNIQQNIKNKNKLKIQYIPVFSIYAKNSKNKTYIVNLFIINSILS